MVNNQSPYFSKKEKDRLQEIIAFAMKRQAEILQGYIEAMCAAYLMHTDIPPDEVELIEDRSSAYEIKWYFQRKGCSEWIEGEPGYPTWCLVTYLSNDDPPARKVQKLWFNPSSFHKWWIGSPGNCKKFEQSVIGYMLLPLPMADVPPEEK